MFCPGRCVFTLSSIVILVIFIPLQHFTIPEVSGIWMELRVKINGDTRVGRTGQDRTG